MFVFPCIVYKTVTDLITFKTNNNLDCWIKYGYKETFLFCKICDSNHSICDANRRIWNLENSKYLFILIKD